MDEIETVRLLQPSFQKIPRKNEIVPFPRMSGTSLQLERYRRTLSVTTDPLLQTSYSLVLAYRQIRGLSQTP